MKKHFIATSILVFIVFLLTTSCGSNYNKSNNKDNSDSTKYEYHKPEKLTEEQEKDDMI